MSAGSLRELVAQQLSAGDALSAREADAVLAAFPAGPVETTADTLLNGMFLSSISVRGFRGIGPRTTLRLQPSLGLTLVVGRNGCGKSSFAEAAELALTGDNKRWAGKSKIWTDGWRNLHEGDAPEIEVGLQTECVENPLKIAGRWGADTALGDAEWTARRKSADPTALNRATLANALELYRPFLSYSELGTLIEGSPSGMHDALHRLLGLDDLTTALAGLQQQRLSLDKVTKEVKREKDSLLASLAAVNDDRARKVSELVKSQDLTELSRAVVGGGATSSAGPGLAAVGAVRLPSEAEVSAAVATLGVATARLVAVATTDAASDAARIELLTRALEFDADRCPVCEEGTLDDEWRARTIRLIEETRSRTTELDAARLAHADATTALARLIQPVPPALLDSPIPADDAIAAWREWSDLALVDPSLAAHALPSHHERVLAALNSLQIRARTELALLDEVWSPLARRVAAWVEMANAAAHAPERLKTVRAAENWLKNAAAELREERMRPLTELSQQVWTTLRQQSNVELGGIALAGSASSRRVSLDVNVDGVEGAALGVMSQGELHALALSLFLPRATAEQSPFRFLVIDDPVQSMDPAKVDGLARVLAEVARTRQVVVFTHDLRLPEAVRRLQIPATVLDVQRREKSVVKIRVSLDPVRRYLDDARALSLTKGLPRNEANEMIALCCRLAIESAATSKVRRVLGEHGFAQSDITEQLEKADRTVQKIALAVLYDRDREADALAQLDAGLAPWASDVVRACNRGAHGSSPDDLTDLINRTERIAKWLNK
ncbi:ATP-binding protein [Nocardia camponoti]|uniref:Nuclease SbcCD subunit C n=1 Tax=Nocardia camponoti TaxID=1616106 RepID=A0A917QSX0_9NOCA|nr:ATP-binding protein [Nocardia camponoti]GGK66957.1 hypothetical protein GCM10011591_43880 [Nocardia camponoti]